MLDLSLHFGDDAIFLVKRSSILHRPLPLLREGGISAYKSSRLLLLLLLHLHQQRGSLVALAQQLGVLCIA